MITTLFTEFYWWGVLFSGLIVWMFLITRNYFSYKENTIFSLLWFVPIFLSWYYVLFFAVWFILTMIWNLIIWIWYSFKELFNL